MSVPIHYYLILSTMVFFIGVYGFIARRNLIMMLMSIELILNAVNINFVVFNRYLYPDLLEGFFFMLFVVAIAAAETAVVIAIVINLYRKKYSITEDDVREMKH